MAPLSSAGLASATIQVLDGEGIRLGGMGLAFLPHLAVGRELRRRSLVAIEIVDAEPISRSLDVIHPRPRPLSSAARALLHALRSALSEAGGPPRRRR